MSNYKAKSVTKGDYHYELAWHVGRQQYCFEVINTLFGKGKTLVFFDTETDALDYALSHCGIVLDTINSAPYPGYQWGKSTHKVKISGSQPQRLPKPIKCECGAKYTSNPNYHLSWCPLAKRGNNEQTR